MHSKRTSENSGRQACRPSPSQAKAMCYFDQVAVKAVRVMEEHAAGTWCFSMIRSSCPLDAKRVSP